MASLQSKNSVPRIGKYFWAVTTEQVSDCGSAFLFNFPVLEGHPTPDLLLVQIISPFVEVQVCLKGEKTRTKAFPTLHAHYLPLTEEDAVAFRQVST